MGWRWLAFRLYYAVAIRSGHIERKLPVNDWSSQPLKSFLTDTDRAAPQRYLEQRRSDDPAFFFNPSQIDAYRNFSALWDAHHMSFISPATVAENVRAGTLQYFEHAPVHTGFPPNWHKNPVTCQEAPVDRHWSRIGDFGHGDIKVIWEANRFGFTYALVRAYRRTGDEAYAECFWQLVADWKGQNRPQSGVNWKCGQEISIRLMAWLFGLQGFLSARSTTPERVADLAQMIAVSADRIEKNIAYAISQENNHGVSEALGLWTVGLLFPEFRDAKRWKEKGRHYLEKLATELIYDDGSFVQHSVNYHRLMLHDYLWAMRLGDLNGQPFSDHLKAKVQKGGEFLFQLQDEKTGKVPYYGQNDGALILPLSNCDYLDFRPVVQAVHYYFTGERLFENGPWDEDLLWLFGPEALSSPVKAKPREDLHAEAGGYYTLRTDAGFAFVRCATFRHRPSQADMLHCDLWWRGHNITVDAGTYSYNAPEPWNNPLAHSACHNTVTVDGRDQMDRAGKFLWLPWLNAKVHCMKRSPAGSLAYWEGSHDGYRRLKSPVDHRRGILQLGDESWLVLDHLAGSILHRYRLHWLFPDLKYSWQEALGLLSLETEAGPYHIKMADHPGKGAYSLVRADEQSPRGWRAPYYSCREPALSVDLTVENSKTFFWTLFSPDLCDVTSTGDCMAVTSRSWRADLQLETGQADNMIARVTLSGKGEDRLDLS
jgi:asparagine synthase (glutamine-hydrolysing)